MTPSDPYPVLLLLRAHLEGRLRQGGSRVWLKAEAAEALREIVRMKPQPRPAVVPVVTASLKEAVVTTAMPDSDIIEEIGSLTQTGPIQGEPMPAERPHKEPELKEHPQRLVLPPFPAASLSLAEKETQLAVAKERALEGREAKALGTLRGQMVFSTGSPMADIVFVGEAPGAEEERRGEPFVGPAGQLLTKVLKVMGLERDQVYITNICKYRPAMENQGSGNRQPSPLEMASCLGFVREELAIIRPRVIVALGGTAITGLLGIKTGVMNARGRFYEFDGVPVMATLHPSYLLRKEQEGPQVATAEKRKFWEDMMMVMERAHMPITDKQRAFFLPK